MKTHKIKMHLKLIRYIMNNQEGIVTNVTQLN